MPKSPDADDSPVIYLTAALPPGRPRTAKPKSMCIRGRTRQPSDDADTVVRIDRRMIIGRAAKRLEESLEQHCGGSPSAVERAIIARSVQLFLRITAMDLDFVATGSHS